MEESQEWGLAPPRERAREVQGERLRWGSEPSGAQALPQVLTVVLTAASDQVRLEKGWRGGVSDPVIPAGGGSGRGAPVRSLFSRLMPSSPRVMLPGHLSDIYR